MNTNRKLDVTISDYDKNGKLLTKSEPQSGIKLQRVMLSPDVYKRQAFGRSKEFGKTPIGM